MTPGVRAALARAPCLLVETGVFAENGPCDVERLAVRADVVNPKESGAACERRQLKPVKDSPCLIDVDVR